ncbi:hypothetical protein C8R47DRAFT_978182, partial [Mycena vitilis]
ALECDPAAEARILVTACRASGQRREAFEKTIKEGHEAGGLGDPAQPLREAILLKDIETRWSVTGALIFYFLVGIIIVWRLAPHESLYYILHN